ncbi:odorant receptor 131-2-like [Pelobates fuscus]|uniref:odorant receptor 131-2-like n=1 Tax=Pelobates fuscus TaxID=191477 RepID=UPI002FE4D785
MMMDLELEKHRTTISQQITKAGLGINTLLKDDRLQPSSEVTRIVMYAIRHQQFKPSQANNSAHSAMVNSTTLYANNTQMTVNTSNIVSHLLAALLAITLLCFFFFLYFITVILNVYFSTPHVRDKARYVLFAHMLINDTLYLLVALILLLSYLFIIRLPMPICYTMLTLAASTFRVTPFNLAAMALERYVAICYPLRYMALCTPRRSNVAIAFMWITGILPNVADFIALSSSVENNFFSLRTLCKQELISMSPLQNIMRSMTFIVSLTMVGLTILFTYVKVMLVAGQMRSGNSSASKAGKTVMLHAFQLLLCMVSLTSSITESNAKDYAAFLIIINFLLFMCLPRFLSPFIYGIRDKVFSKCIRQIYFSKC